VIIEEGDLGEEGFIGIDTTPGTTTAIEEANKKDDLNLRINRVKGTMRQFIIHNATITGTVRIGIPYPDENPEDGYVDGTKIRETTLKIYKLVGTGTDAIWKKIDSEVDSINNIVYADVSSFSFFILMGAGFESNLDKAFVYPNPYYASKHEYIWFDRLTENSVIKIFTIAGELVKEIHVTSSPQRWDVKKDSLASGIYIYLIKDPAGNKKVGKLGVIK
jgi:hypothetical protein